MANSAYHRMIRRQRRRQLLEDTLAGLCTFATIILLIFIP